MQLTWSANTIRGINEGRSCARDVDLFLEKSSYLPTTGGIVKSTALEILGREPALETNNRAERTPIQVAVVAS